MVGRRRRLPLFRQGNKFTTIARDSFGVPELRPTDNKSLSRATRSANENNSSPFSFHLGESELESSLWIIGQQQQNEADNDISHSTQMRFFSIKLVC